MGRRWVVGIDVGNTRLSVGLVSEGGELGHLEREATPREAGGPATIETLCSMIERVLKIAGEVPVLGIGVGFGGPVDYGRQETRMSHHAPGWEGIRLGEVLGRRFGIPVRIENDANAGGLGEAVFGAGRGHSEVLYVNIGTGVGGAVITNGAVLHGAHSNAGEFGHMVIDPSGPPCTCDKRGCVEAFCSGDAIGLAACGLREQGRGFEQYEAQELTGRKVGELAQSGDADALGVIERSAERMGFALALAADLLDPGIIVLGGGVPELGNVYLGPVRAAFRAYAMDVPAQETEVVAAHLGYNAGVIGAAAVCLQQPLS
ncbi:MAG: ROK family protein [Armatimonadia bacterium]